jgi:hypothetical protein
VTAVDYFSEFQRLIARYQLAWDQWDWADPLHQEQANAELTAAVIALNTFIQEQKGLQGIPARGQHHAVIYRRLSRQQGVS